MGTPLRALVRGSFESERDACFNCRVRASSKICVRYILESGRGASLPACRSSLMAAGLQRESDQRPSSASNPCPLLLACSRYFGVCPARAVGNCGHCILLGIFQMAHAHLGVNHRLHWSDFGGPSSTVDSAGGGSTSVCVIAVFSGRLRLSDRACLSGTVRRDDAAVGDISLSRIALSLLSDSVRGSDRRLYPTACDYSPAVSEGRKRLGIGAGWGRRTRRGFVLYSHFKAEGRLRRWHHQWMARQFLLSSGARQSASVRDRQNRRSFPVRLWPTRSRRHCFHRVYCRSCLALERTGFACRFECHFLAIGSSSRFTVRSRRGSRDWQNLSLWRNAPFCIPHHVRRGWRQLFRCQVGEAADCTWNCACPFDRRSLHRVRKATSALHASPRSEPHADDSCHGIHPCTNSAIRSYLCRLPDSSLTRLLPLPAATGFVHCPSWKLRGVSVQRVSSGRRGSRPLYI